MPRRAVARRQSHFGSAARISNRRGPQGPRRRLPPPSSRSPPHDAAGADAALRGYLAGHGFTGRIAETLEARLGRHIDRQLADIGRQLWFDPIHGLNDDNTCAGCHSPTNGFGDTQPIAIGIDNNRHRRAGATRARATSAERRW